MSSQPQPAASAAPFAAYVPLREPCVAFASPAVQAFFARCGRMAEIKRAWLQAAGATAGPSDTLREIDVPALADPTLEAIEELTTPVAPAKPEATVEDILFAPFDLATLDASLFGGVCSFRSRDDEVATSADATAWAADAQSAACMPTMTNPKTQAVAAADEGDEDDDGELLLIDVDDELGDEDELPTLESVEGEMATAADESVAESSTVVVNEVVDADELPTLEPVEAESVTAANDAVAETSTVAVNEVAEADELPELQSVEEETVTAADDAVAEASTVIENEAVDVDELPTLQSVEAETVTAENDAVAETSTVIENEVVDADELPTLEPVEEETVTAANDAEAETSTVAATEVVDADELPTLDPVEEDGELVTSHGLAACTTNDSTAWQPDTDGDVAVLDASSTEEFTAPTATEWSPESDAEAAVAVAIAEPMTAVEEVAQPAAVAAAAPAAAVVNASETTAPPAPPPTVASAAPSRADSELEQMQHHVLTAREQLRAVTPPDVSPALSDLRTELGRQGEMLAANVAAVQQLDERLGGLGAAVQQATTAATQLAAAPAAAATATPLVEPVSLRAPLAVAALGATWSVLLWWKTGSTALATGTLVAANLVAGLWLGRGRG